VYPVQRREIRNTDPGVFLFCLAISAKTDGSRVNGPAPIGISGNNSPIYYIGGSPETVLGEEKILRVISGSYIMQSIRE